MKQIKQSNKKFQIFSVIAIVLAISCATIIVENPEIINKVTGAITARDFAPQSFEYQGQDQVSNSQVQTKLARVIDSINQAESIGLTTNLSHDLLEEAIFAVEEERLQNADELAELILYLNKEQQQLQAQISDLNKQLIDLQLQHPSVDFTQTINHLVSAQTELDNERIDQSEAQIQAAIVTLQEAGLIGNQLQGVITLTKNVWQLYYKEIVIGLAAVLLLSIPFVKWRRRVRLKRKIRRMKKDIYHYRQNIKSLQKQCFIQKKISVDAYNKKVSQYEEKLTKLKHTLPVLEERLSNKKTQSQKSTKIEPTAILKVSSKKTTKPKSTKRNIKNKRGKK